MYECVRERKRKRGKERERERERESEVKILQKSTVPFNVFTIE